MLQTLELKIPCCPGIRNKKHCAISIVRTLIFSSNFVLPNAYIGATREIKYVVSWFFVAVRWAIYGNNGVAIKYTAVILNSKNIVQI